jgi:Ca2+-binding EF-hand superfamily protein
LDVDEKIHIDHPINILIISQQRSAWLWQFLDVMGACLSEREKTPEELDYELAQEKYGQQFRALRLKDHEVKQLHEIFWYLDLDHLHWLDIQEIYGYVGMKPTKYSDFIFNHYNTEATYGFIPFRDFVVILWNYCSLSPSPLVDFVFSQYDKDGSGDIDIEEAKQLILSMFGESFQKSPEAVRVVAELNLMKQSGGISLETFHHFVKMNPSILSPAYQLQIQLRKRILGDEFWLIQGKRRVEVNGTKELMTADEILKRFDNRSEIPPTPAEVAEQNKYIAPVVLSEKKPKKGSTEWKKERMSFNNPHIK